MRCLTNRRLSRNWLCLTQGSSRLGKARRRTYPPVFVKRRGIKRRNYLIMHCLWLRTTCHEVWLASSGPEREEGRRVGQVVEEHVGPVRGEVVGTVPAGGDGRHARPDGGGTANVERRVPGHPDAVKDQGAGDARPRLPGALVIPHHS